MLSDFLPTMSIAGVLAVFAPLAITALAKLAWSPQTKQLFAIVIAVILAVIAFFGTGGLDQIPGNENPMAYILTIVLVVIAIAQVAFKLIWQPTGVDAKIAAATATKSEKAEFMTENTVAGTVDSTESQAAEAIRETDATPPDPGWSPKH